MTDSSTKNIYIIAGAIVIAGLIVAGSVALSKNSAVEEEVNQSSQQSSPQIPSSGGGCGV